MSAPDFTKTLIIAGPTATGKTNLALKIAQNIPADLISADSRQVYQGLDVIPGKDIPKNFQKRDDQISFLDKPLPIYTNGETKIYGYDIVAPNQDWSVSLFNKFCAKVIPHLWRQKRLPIVVGGTGFYLQSLYQPIDTLHVPPNQLLRQKLQNQSVSSLQKKLKKLDSQYLDSLNRSDKNNPRRLIRAIEVAQYKKKNPDQKPQQFILDKKQTKKLLLTAPQETISDYIEKRVVKRFSQDWRLELDYLKQLDLDWSQPSATSLGYRQLSKFQQGKLSEKQALKIWAQKEKQYAKYQNNWFQNQSGFEKISITSQNYPQKVVHSVSRWYSKN